MGNSVAGEIMRRWRLYIWMAVVCFCPNAQCLASDDWKLQFDAQADGHYSRYNFPDLKHPYEGIYAWGELKAALWPKTGKAISPYISVIPASTTESEFWWQRNVTSALGLQLYPTDFLQTDKGLEHGEVNWWRSFRLYATYGFREYCDKPSREDPQDEDFRVGFDYYHDNLLHKDVLTWLVWTNLTYRSTNYSLADYDAVVWEGNAKIGPKLPFNADNSILLPYAVFDWTYAPDYPRRWWENFLRAGVGIRLYPKVSGITNNQLARLMSRFNIYAEILHNVSWLEDDAPDRVEETDWRIGITFSTFWER